MVTTDGYLPLFFSEQGLPELVVRPYHARVFAQNEYYRDPLSSPVLRKAKEGSDGDLWDIFFFSPACGRNNPCLKRADRKGEAMQ